MSNLGNCPKCGSPMEAEFVDIGIGHVQVTEAICTSNCDEAEFYYAGYVALQTEKQQDVLSFDDWMNSQMR